MLVVMTAFLIGCKPAQSFSGGYTSRDLEGAWLDDSGTTAVIKVADRQALVTSIVDSDGEVFQVVESGRDQGLFHWTAYVPSTSTTYEVWIDSVDGDSATSRWRNDTDEGREGLTRVSR